MTPFDLASGLPLSLGLRIGIAVVTVLAARRQDVARRVAFLGSATASLATGLVAAQVLGTGTRVKGVLYLHQASEFSLGYSIDGLSAWFLLVLSVVAVPIAFFSLGYIGGPHWSRRSAFLGVMFNVLLGAVELVFVADDLITFLCGWELMTLATAALVVTEHEERTTRRAAYLYLVMSHLATGFLIAGFLMLASAYGSLSFATLLSGGTAIRTDTRHLVRVLFHWVWREGRHHPAPCLVTRGAPGRAHQHLRADVGRPHQDRHLRHRAGLCIWARCAAAVVGRDRAGHRRSVSRAGRPLCADAARSQTPPGVSQHRKHRDHSPGPWRGDDRRCVRPADLATVGLAAGLCTTC